LYTTQGFEIIEPQGCIASCIQETNNVPRGTHGVFAFTHQTFLEYFFARYVDEKADTVSEVLDEIIPHVLRNEWDVVAHLSLQIKTHRSLRRQNQAIDQLIALLSRSRPVDEQRALASFAARSLQYLVASESQVKLLVELIFLRGYEHRGR
jgi:hypothetical protein